MLSWYVYIKIDDRIIEEFTIDGTIPDLTTNQEFIDNYKRIQLEHPNETLSYTAFKYRVDG